MLTLATTSPEAEARPCVPLKWPGLDGPNRFESVHSHALTSALENSGMHASGLRPVCHPIGGAAAEGG